MPGPLAGVRVVDVSTGMAGPRATGLLADYGADVVWVEPPRGDRARPSLAGPYSVFNRGKRSLVLDLKTEEGRKCLRQLIQGADVLVESDDLGDVLGPVLDAKGMRDWAPSLVRCSITGFGRDGVHDGVPPREALVHALVGTMGEQVGHREGPIFEGLPFASIGAAYLATIGILGALIRRDNDGVGRHVETSLYDGALAYLSIGWGDVDRETADSDLRGKHRLLAASFLCGDDEYIGIHTGAVGAFGRLMTVLGFDDRIPPTPNGIDIGEPLTPEQQAILRFEIHDVFASKPRKEWLDLLLEADICAIPHLRPGQAFDEPQSLHNGIRLTLDDPALGRIDQVGPPIRFGAFADSRHPRPAPAPGQHDDELTTILSEWSDPKHSERRSASTRPLFEGLKILDLGAFYAGPYSSRLLADLGADVIKLEPTQGDPLRRLERVFRSAQMGKRSLAADLKDPDLDAARRRLIEWADIIHHNMRPGAAERLGIGYEQARAINPNVIYVYAPGWGVDGPDAYRQSFAPMLSGYVGIGFEVAGQYNAPLFPVGNEDSGNGLLGAVGMLMALYHRQRTGEGQLVVNPQLNAAMAHMAHIVRREDGVVLGAERLDPLQRGVSPLERLYETADGWICIAVADGEVAELERATGVALVGDERFATPEAREANAYALEESLGAAFAARTTASWVEALRSAGVPAAVPVPHNAISFLRDPENRRSGRVFEYAHETQGRVRGVGALLRVSDCSSASPPLAPELGEHSDEILRWLGYDSAQIQAMHERGVVTSRREVD